MICKINFFCKKLIFWWPNLTNNESDTGKPNLRFYSNDIKRCNILKYLFFSSFYKKKEKNKMLNNVPYMLHAYATWRCYMKMLHAYAYVYKLQLQCSHGAFLKIWKNARRSYDQFWIERKSELIRKVITENHHIKSILSRNCCRSVTLYLYRLI